MKVGSKSPLMRLVPTPVARASTTSGTDSAAADTAAPSMTGLVTGMARLASAQGL
ncbi:MAG: hypothetical protein K0M78_01715 [Brevundimonas sp.]|nr:hypothetical protein [Brevundimonas sp.]